MPICNVGTFILGRQSMEIIKSYDNKTVKKLNKLKQKKYRDEYGEFFVEGYKNVLDTCSACGGSVKSIVMSESAFKQKGDVFADFNIVVMADRGFEKVGDTQSSQGVLSINAVPKSVFPDKPRCVLLDRVRDPGNVGTILRTAVACGYDVIANNCADIFSPKVTRSAMSAVLKCNIGIDISPCDVIAAGYELIVADMGGDSVFSAGHCDKYCIVIGNEGEGVSEDIKKLADRVLSLPQDNMESLNAAVAAAVMMFELRYAK